MRRLASIAAAGLLGGCDPVAFSPSDATGALVLGASSCQRWEAEQCLSVSNRSFVEANGRYVSYYAPDGWHYYSTGKTISRDQWFLERDRVLTHGTIIGSPRKVADLIRDHFVLNGDLLGIASKFAAGERTYLGSVSTLDEADRAAFERAMGEITGRSGNEERR